MGRPLQKYLLYKYDEWVFGIDCQVVVVVRGGVWYVEG